MVLSPYLRTSVLPHWGGSLTSDILNLLYLTAGLDEEFNTKDTTQ